MPCDRCQHPETEAYLVDDVEVSLCTECAELYDAQPVEDLSDSQELKETLRKLEKEQRKWYHIHHEAKTYEEKQKAKIEIIHYSMLIRLAIYEEKGWQWNNPIEFVELLVE